ncbi:hypothetical protein HY385_00160 [Candidatus Daviesbacteria bacterium]|nr:hypothetical protein [Candidatus Daviesbacteria bacterium]
MQSAQLLAVVVGDIILGIIALVYIKRFNKAVLKHEEELEQRDLELRRKVLELQVLRSLGERAGYSLDVHQILEVILDSLAGLVDFSTVSYMMFGKKDQIFLKTRVATPVSRTFLDQVKQQMLQTLSSMNQQDLQPTFVDETVVGNVLDGTLDLPIGSFFNLPLVINGKITALVTVASQKKQLYNREDIDILNTIFTQVSSQASKLSQVIENEKRRLTAMVASLTDGVMMVDSSLNVIVTNRILPKVLGLDKEITSLFEVVAALGTVVDLRSAIQQAFSQQSVVKLPEVELKDTVLQIDVEPVKDQIGYLLGVVVVFHDVSKQKQLEHLKEEFTAMMVHELRTPITTIFYSVDGMLADSEKMSPSQLEQNLRIIKSTSDEMLSLVNELLDVAKIEAGKFIVNKTVGDLGQFIKDQLVVFQPQADHNKLALTSEIGEGLTKVPFDQNRIGQVMNNLLSNALKYTDAGQIKVTAKGDNGQVAVTVADSGEGINPADLPKLFSKFEQLGRDGKKVGTGLGLVVAKGIVEAHGGKIWANSQGLGKGTTFTFSLPL